MLNCKFLLLFLMVLCSGSISGQNLTELVNPFIGSSNFGTTNPGAIAPQGMVSVVPFNVTGSDINKWDKDKQWWSTPYSSDNKFFTGFSHVNLSGVGCPDLGVILLMPTTGSIDADLSNYGSVVSKEKASPGYYNCFLDKYRIDAEATATQRVGTSKFTFPKGESNILIDLGNGLTNETGGSIKIVNQQEVEGYRMTGNFCYHADSERPIYFVARFSRSADRYGVWKKMPPMDAEAAWSSTDDSFNYYEGSKVPMAGDNVGAYLTFDTESEESITVRVGVSYVSIENARENLETEQPNSDFDEVRKTTTSRWESLLSKVKVEGGSRDDKTVLYTALYHLHIHPNVINDVNGDYPIMDSYDIGNVKGRDRYTTFSLWDTYRNYHPLMSLLYPDLQLDFVNSMIDMYKESGWLPKWELNSRETYTMNGDPSFPVIADTYLRGLTDFDIETAYEAMIKHTTTASADNKIRKENDFYLAHGYVPLRKEFDNSTSVGLELYIADWNLSQFAKALGKDKDYKRYLNQSLGYKNYFDRKEFKMIRPKLVDGSFISEFDPMQGANFKPVNGFHEGTAWQYTFCVQHDIKGLAKLMGGDRAFVKTLQMVFDDNLFDMANEPDMHYPYLFNYVKGEEWRAQKEVRSLLAEHFKNEPAGLPGNDDCGTMSAWAVYSMIGLYPVCPGDMNYAVIAPTFDKITIDLDPRYYGDEDVVITKSGLKDYISEIVIGDKRVKSFFISHDQLVKGATIDIKL